VCCAFVLCVRVVFVFVFVFVVLCVVCVCVCVLCVACGTPTRVLAPRTQARALLSRMGLAHPSARPPFTEILPKLDADFVLQ
jgi:hypothetical protein